MVTNYLCARMYRTGLKTFCCIKLAVKENDPFPLLESLGFGSRIGRHLGISNVENSDEISLWAIQSRTDGPNSELDYHKYSADSHSRHGRSLEGDAVGSERGPVCMAWGKCEYTSLLFAVRACDVAEPALVLLISQTVILIQHGHIWLRAL